MNNQIIWGGAGFRQCFFTEEEFEENMKRSEFYTSADFIGEYRRHMAAMSHIAECAKSYILRNWSLVKDWSGLEVEISGGDVTHYYKHTESGSRVVDPTTRRFNQNPAVSVSDVVLDPTDGDFSMTINGKEHWWLRDDEVIVIAGYIEKQLEIQDGNKTTAD
jgi:hypothetical protein